MTEESDVHRATTQYPPAEITPAEFEVFVTSLFESAKESVTNLVIQLHERITGVDGTYDFDGTVRYEMAGMQFLVLVEAKRHKDPIKRELVQILHSKLQSVGAHKAVMVSTAPYQSGALAFALTHGIALVTVTEGRFTYETKSMEGRPSPSRDEARDWFGLPTFVGHCYSPTEPEGSVQMTVMSAEQPEYVAELLLDPPEALTSRH